MDKKILKNKLQKYNIYVILVVILAVACIASPDFRTYGNITNLLGQMSIVGILAIGQTVVLITGGFDLSHGSYVALSSILLATFMQWGIPAAIILTIVILFCLGFFNGFFINRGVAPLITTLGMTGIARSMAFAISGTDAIPLPPGTQGFMKLAYGKLLGMPYSVYFWIILVVIFAFILRHMRIGRHIYAVGGNKESARLSGVNVKKVIYIGYIMSALCAVAATLVYTARMGAALPDKAVGYEMDSIAASVIGGASLFGGLGTQDGTLVGVLIYGIITNFLNIIGVSTYWQQVIKGIIIAVAVFFNTRIISKRKGEALADG